MDKLINDFKISYTKGDTYALAIKFKNLSEDLRTAFFTVKENPDDEPLIQKSLGFGIDKIDDRIYKNEKTYKVQLQAEDTLNLEAHVQYLYDLQVTVGNVVKTVISGVFVVTHSLSGNASLLGNTLEIEVDDTLETEVSTTPATKGIEYEQDPVACTKIGDIKLLTTTAKNTIVEAINEVKSDTSNNLKEINDINKKTKTIEENINGILDGTKQVKKSLNSVNSDNAIKNNDGTYSGFTKDEKNVLKTENDVIPRNKIIYKPETPIGITNNGTDVSLSDIEFANKTFEFAIKYLGGLYSLKMFLEPTSSNQFATFHLFTDIKDITSVNTIPQIYSENIMIMYDYVNSKFNLSFTSKYVNLQDFTITKDTSDGAKAELVAIYEVIK